MKLIQINMGGPGRTYGTSVAMAPMKHVKSLPPCVAGIGSGIGKSTAACSGDDSSCGRLHCHVRRLARHQHAFLQNDTQTHIHWVRAGVLRLYKGLANGRRQIVGFAFPGDFVGLGGETRYRFSAQAIAPTELRVMPRSAFEGIAADDPRFSSKLYEAVASDLRRTHELALTVGQRNSESSLAAFLLEMRVRTNAETNALTLQMPRSDIADYLGLTTETVSRTFSKLARRGLIHLSGRRGVSLKDPAVLERLAEGLPDTKRPPLSSSGNKGQRT